MIDVIDAWLRLAAARLHDQARRADRARPGHRRRRPRHQHGPRVRGHRGDARRRRGPRATSEPAIAGGRLRTAGRTLISTVGGAAGPLYGTALMRAGGAVAACRADASGRARSWSRPRCGDRRDPVARQGRRPARRPCSTRSCPPLAAGRDARRDAGADAGRRGRGHGRCRRGRRRRHDPDARDQGPGVLPRRAVDRASGSRAPRRPRCCCGRSPTSPAALTVERRWRGPWPEPVPRPGLDAGPVLVGRPGAPGVGVGRAAGRRAARSRRPARPAWRDPIGRGP